VTTNTASPAIWTCETWNAKPYLQWAGARIVSAEAGVARIELAVEPHHHGAADTPAVNGAILAYLHDIVQGAAIRSLLGADVLAIATLNLNITYVDMLPEQRVVVGEGRVVSVRSAVAFAQSDFRNAAGAVCCQAVGTFRVVRQRADRPRPA
jgi:uncharacterized protein (TIGR00369 family)